MANVSSSNGLEKRPKLRFPGFEEPWKDTFFSDLYEAVSEKNDGSFGVENIISVANMYFKEDARITDEEYLKTYNIFKVGDIAFEGNKSNDFSHGRFVENTIGDGIVSHVFVVFRPLHDTHNLRYWKYAINNESVMGRILARCTKKTTMMTNLVTKDFLNQTILCPSAQEQDKIANLLDGISERIKLQKLYVESLKKYKRGLLNKLFSNINSNIYPTVYLSEVADFLQGLTYSPSDVSVSGYLVLRSSNIQNGMLSFDDCVYVDKKVDESLQVKCDDVIMCVRNGSKNLVGKTALIPPNMPMTTWGAFMMIIRSKLNDTYIFHYLNSQMFFSQVFKDTGTATINQITKGILNECRLPLPPETERKQISKMLSSFDAKIQNAEKCLATLVNLKKALLQQLFI